MTARRSTSTRPPRRRRRALGGGRAGAGRATARPADRPHPAPARGRAPRGASRAGAAICVATGALRPTALRPTALRLTALCLSMVCLCATALCATALCATAAAQTAAAEEPPGAGHFYRIRAELDPDAHTVTGEALIRWVNESAVPAQELWLHLYLNAFASEDTVFMRESAGALRGVRREGTGRIELTELALDDGRDLLAGARTDAVEHDETQMRVPLPAPVPAGARIVFRARFVSHLPPVFARSGHAGTFHAVAQFFPKVAVREPDGSWATFPYHGNGEFYADFGRYELEVTTPETYVVGATGLEVEERRTAGKVTRRFVADRVHDTVFVAWDHFLEQRFDVQGTRVRMLYPPGYEAALARHARVVRRGLVHYGASYGDYPYPVLTVVIPPRGAEGAAGMEYPTLFLTAGSWLDTSTVRLGQEDVTAHELGHQWFQGLVATHEVRWPMLDEGLTEWATGDLLRSMHGGQGSAATVAGHRIDRFEVIRMAALGKGPKTTPPGRPAHAFGDGEYGRSVYGRTALVLETIARTWGRARLRRALGLYAREQRFGHPGPSELFDAFDRTYWRGFSASLLEPALMDGEDAELRVASLRSRERGGEWVTEVDARRVGSLPVPTTVLLQDAEGGVRRLPWRAGEARLLVTHRGPARVVRAEIDPDRHVLLDPARADNVRTLVSDDASGALFARLLALFGQLLGGLGP